MMNQAMCSGLKQLLHLTCESGRKEESAQQPEPQRKTQSDPTKKNQNPLLTASYSDEDPASNMSVDWYKGESQHLH